ncbi:MAG: NAD(P)H-dependent glycerol-3-phosphate dehydrogenase [Dehalococcoidia bacterium]|jgi:glycerol-3-phosphate dehydrogenase (NAD(P)+)
MERAAVVGATRWGTVLAVLLARNGAAVRLSAFDEADAAAMRRDGENARLQPGLRFPPSLEVTLGPAETLEGATLLVVAVPSSTLRDNLRALRPHLDPSTLVLSAVKGLERDSAKRMSEVFREEWPEMAQPLCVLSGPNLSREIAQGLPAATIIACEDLSLAERAREALMSPQLRVYTNDDVAGVELAGALKNIIAIGAGFCDGFGLGDNARAGFVTRGLAEIARLGVAAGARPLTFLGLAGVGDLVATCYSPLSRNHRLGVELAKGRSLEDILPSLGGVAEGVTTTVAALDLARRLGVEMPITEKTCQVLFEGLDPRVAAVDLMGRSPRHELHDVPAAHSP